MSAITEYKLLSTDEDVVTAVPQQPSDWREYPGSRRGDPRLQEASEDTLFVKTAGNALQAVPRETVQQPRLLQVTVPAVAKPGDEILVVHGSQHVRATIPPSANPGSVFFVQLPEPIVVTGVPVDSTEVGGSAVIIGSRPVSAENDLALAEEESYGRGQSSTGTGALAQKRQNITDEGFELV